MIRKPKAQKRLPSTSTTRKPPADPWWQKTSKWLFNTWEDFGLPGKPPPQVYSLARKVQQECGAREMILYLQFCPMLDRKCPEDADPGAWFLGLLRRAQKYHCRWPGMDSVEVMWARLTGGGEPE